MHPFYAPSAGLLGGRGSSATGLLSMAAYLAFWAVALVIAKRELDARFPRTREPDDPAMTILRERFARGELDETRFAAMTAVLRSAQRRE